MAPHKQMTCIPIHFTCFKTKFISPEPKINQNSSQRISLSDISDSGSPHSLINDLSSSLIGSNLHIFTLFEIKSITQNFSSNSYLGEGGFGAVHKGFVEENFKHGLKSQFVAVKALDLEGNQGHMEWLAEVVFLGQLRHAHLVKLIGYCCEDEHRMLVYEYIMMGSLERRLFGRYTAPLPWLTRIKIAIGAAKGLAFLHEEEKPVIYRDFKSSNILLDNDYNAKLSDFGLATDGPKGDETHVTTRVMGTEGYAAPEYLSSGHLTTMIDVYSYGVVLLELITGIRSLDKSRPNRKQNLVNWARPQLKSPQKLYRIIDPKLEGQFSNEGAKKVAALAYKCLSSHPKSRPTMSNVVKTLEPLLDLNDIIPVGPFFSIGSNEEKKEKKNDVLENVEKRGERENSQKRRHRKRGSRSRSVYSDTTLYRTFGSSLYSLEENNHELGKGVEAHLDPNVNPELKTCA